MVILDRHKVQELVILSPHRVRHKVQELPIPWSFWTDTKYDTKYKSWAHTEYNTKYRSSQSHGHSGRTQSMYDTKYNAMVILDPHKVRELSIPSSMAKWSTSWNSKWIAHLYGWLVNIMKYFLLNRTADHMLCWPAWKHQQACSLTCLRERLYT
jgi:hypothetical protein